MQNAVDNLTSMIQIEEDLENYQIAAIQTVGLFGMYFTFFSGLALDRWGPIKVGAFGAVMISFGYMIMALSAFYDSQSSGLHH
jgi:MFS family permease